METLWLHPRCEWLMSMPFNFHSQFGEDGLLSGIFARLGHHGGDDWAVEVGAHDGVTNSNARHFLDTGWKCVFIEKDLSLFEQLVDVNRHHPTAYNVHETIEATGPNSIDGILDDLDVPDDPDLLSLDIDGDGLEAVMLDRIRREFTVIVCEIKHTRDTSDLVRSVAIAHDYTPIARTRTNLICVHNDEVDALFNGSPDSAP